MNEQSKDVPERHQVILSLLLETKKNMCTKDHGLSVQILKVGFKRQLGLLTESPVGPEPE